MGKKFFADGFKWGDYYGFVDMAVPTERDRDGAELRNDRADAAAAWARHFARQAGVGDFEQYMPHTHPGVDDQGDAQVIEERPLSLPAPGPAANFTEGGQGDEP